VTVEPLAIELGPTGLAIAFSAGFLSFASPCVLPLVPAYLSLVAGVAVDDIRSRSARVSACTAAFVAGFGAMFVALGAGAAWLGGTLLENRRPLEVAGGIGVIAAALIVAGAPLPHILAAERRLQPRWRSGGPVRAGLAGLAFALGWTPCIGPTLAAILTLSAARGDAASGAVLLAAYALGLGVPFLLAGLVFTRALTVARVVRVHRRAVNLGSGAVMALFGGLLATGQLERLFATLARVGSGWQL